MKLFDSLTSLLLKPATLVVALVLSVGAAGLAYNQYQVTQNEVRKLRENPQAAVQQEASLLIGKIGQLVALPEGENPTVATITDIEKLKEQPFFAKAQNGDKVLIYTQAKRAYLYSMTMNKVLEIAPVNIGQNQESKVAGASTEEKPTPTKAPKKSE